MRDLTGRIFHYLTVKGRATGNRSGSIIWECICKCGNNTTYSSDHLTRKTCPVKSCGCYKAEKRGENHSCWNGIGDISGHWWHAHVLRERTQNIRKRVPVTVTKEDAWELFIKQNKKCALTGLNLIISNVGIDNTASIDRIDSTKGYELGNIQWVHKHVNFMKRTYSQEYFIEMCKRVAETHKQ